MNVIQLQADTAGALLKKMGHYVANLSFLSSYILLCVLKGCNYSFVAEICDQNATMRGLHCSRNEHTDVYMCIRMCVCFRENKKSPKHGGLERLDPAYHIRLHCTQQFKDLQLSNGGKVRGVIFTSPTRKQPLELLLPFSD